jgi:hypothetical protein
VFTPAFQVLSAVFFVAVKSRPPPEEETKIHLLWEWIEDNAWVSYPVIALVVIGLIAGAMISTARQQVMSAERRGQLKMQIMGVMRRRVSGVSAEAIAADLKIDLMLAAKLLVELTDEGMLSRSMTTADDAGARYRLRASGG